MDSRTFIRKKAEIDAEIDFAWDLAMNDGGAALRRAELKRDHLISDYTGKPLAQKTFDHFSKSRRVHPVKARSKKKKR